MKQTESFISFQFIAIKTHRITENGKFGLHFFGFMIARKNDVCFNNIITTSTILKVYVEAGKTIPSILFTNRIFDQVTSKRPVNI